MSVNMVTCRARKYIDFKSLSLYETIYYLRDFVFSWYERLYCNSVFLLLVLHVFRCVPASTHLIQMISSSSSAEA